MRLFSLRYSVAGVFLLAILAAACSQPVMFVHMTDPQVGFRDKTPPFSQSDTLMQKAMAAANMLKPDVVIITGDLIDNPDDSLQYAIFARNLATLEMPVLLVPGNHDMLGYSPERRENYLRLRGYEHFSRRVRDCVFIGIDTNCIKEGDEEAEDAQWDWLLQELAAARNARGVRHIFLFVHCPIVRESLDEPEDYFNFSMEKRSRYLGLLKEYGVEAVFAGHTHCDYHTTVDGIDLYTGNPSGNVLKHGRTGIYLIRANRDGLEVTFVPS
jgi:3',5'-cyclic AMP phosphodiesterase CpdA